MIEIVGVDGNPNSQVVLDATGQQFVELEPGEYRVVAQPVDGFMNAPEVQRVVVEDGRVTEVTFAFDTGIR